MDDKNEKTTMTPFEEDVGGEVWDDEASDWRYDEGDDTGDLDDSQELFEAEPKKKKVRKGPIIAIVLALVFLVGLAGFWYLYTRWPRTVHLEKCIDITYAGYDGLGTVSAEINEEKFLKAVAEAKGISAENAEQYKGLIRSVSIIIEPSENLSNGQNILLKFSYSHSKLRFSQLQLAVDSMSDKVSGLDELKAYNPFNDLEVTFSGTSPMGTVSVMYTGTSELFTNESFTFSKSEGLKNGEKITVVCAVDQEAAAAKGFKISLASKSYTVSGLAAYITGLSDIKEDTLEAMKNDGRSKVAAYLDESEDFSYESLEYKGICAQIPKDFSQFTSTHLYLIYYAKIITPGLFGESYDLYIPIELSTLVTDEEGNQTYSSTSMKRLAGDNITYYSWFRARTIEGYTETGLLEQELTQKNTDQYGIEISDELKQLFT